MKKKIHIALKRGLSFDLFEQDPFIVTPYSMYLANSFPLQANLSKETVVLDFGSGCGIQSLVASLSGAGHLYPVELYQEGVDLTIKNFSLNKIDNYTALNCSRNNWEQKIERKIDLIISNPASLPAPREIAATFWAGPKGHDMIFKLIKLASRHLTPTGSLLFVHTSLVSLKPTLHFLGENGLRAGIVNVKKLAFRDCYTPHISYWQTLLDRGESFFTNEDGVQYEFLYLLKAKRI